MYRPITMYQIVCDRCGDELGERCKELKCSGGDIDCNKDSNCVLAADIISRKLADFKMYEEACGYGAEYNPEVIEKYIEE